MAAFVDRVMVHVAAGNGGHGCLLGAPREVQAARRPRRRQRRRRRRRRPRGRPAACTRCSTSTTARTRRPATARPGEGSNRHGARGEDQVLRVPAGTVVSTPDGEVLADLVGAGTRVRRSPRGGRGGLGNAALANARRKAPGFALLGEPGEALDAVLELKSIADVGLVGFPSAGKSSLIAAMSAARPKIADYPFTTLVPEPRRDPRPATSSTRWPTSPGLIPGASTGKGLGVQFLRHVERCAVLVHVVDMATMEPGRDPESDIEALEHELRRVRRRRARPGRPAADRRPQQDRRARRAGAGRPRARRRWRSAACAVFPVSAATGEGLAEFGYALAARGRAAPRQPAAAGAGPDHRSPRGPSTTAASPSSATRTTRTASSSAAAARALGPADRLHQRRGGRLPRRPAQPARRRGGAGQGRRRARATRSPSAGSPSTGSRPCRPAR